VAEGLSPAEVGKEIAEHRERAHGTHAHTGRDRVVTIVEAALLAAVALLAAWSGYASAKWSTEFRLLLGQASTARVEANRASAIDAEARSFDSSTFDAWFTAYVADNHEAMDVAEHRFRPELRAAFDAWMATDPVNNPDAPSSPFEMPEYAPANQALANKLEVESEQLYAVGTDANQRADDYVLNTVFLATVLFFAGIAPRMRRLPAQLVLVGLAVALLGYGLVNVITYPIE